MLPMALLIGPASCRKMSHNDGLDGQWQITSIEDKETGTVEAVSEQLYYCINLHVIQLTTYGGTLYSGNLHYDKIRQELTFDFPYQADQIAQGDNPLVRFGIHTNPVTFRVVEKTSKRLVLSSPETVITFRRF